MYAAKNSIAQDAPGLTLLLLGNAAIARGFVEAGLQVATSYPGTPATEILETLIAVGKKFGIYTEWSVNEKVAAEVAIAASICGLRAMVSMKGVGVNVASEPFQAFTYMGANGGIVLVSADDVAMHSSHTEQDNRLFAREAYLPVFEPSDAQEAKEFARQALLLSEKWHQPVMLRTTTRVSHSTGKVVLGKLEKTSRKSFFSTGQFVREPERWVNLPANARKMRKELVRRLENIGSEIELSALNKTEGDGENGIIVSGAPYGALKYALRKLGLETECRILKLGISYPLPKKVIEKFLCSVRKVLVVEEVEPFIEWQVAKLANKLGIQLPVAGKEFVPRTGELGPRELIAALSRFTGHSSRINIAELEKDIAELNAQIPARPPVLCAGCGHRNAFYALNIVEKKLGLDIIKPSDIGCYTLGYQPPLNAVDTHFCMGASIGISCGLSKFLGATSSEKISILTHKTYKQTSWRKGFTKNRIVCTIGDSTFFHAGIPPLINCVVTGARATIIILDNGTTAMTGHQPHPGTGRLADGTETKKLAIEKIVRACGVEFVHIVDVFNLGAIVKSIEKALRFDGTSVIIAQGTCAILKLREMRARKEKKEIYYVDKNSCVRCLRCASKFGCPAIQLMDKEVLINPDVCTGCGACASEYVCSKTAIKLVPGGL